VKIEILNLMKILLQNTKIKINTSNNIHKKQRAPPVNVNKDEVIESIIPKIKHIC